MKAFRRFAALALGLCLALSLGGCGSSAAHERQIYAMDTVMSLTAYGGAAETGLDNAVSIINALAASLDPERAGSSVYAINHAEGEGVVVTGQVVEMLETAASVYANSGGALDLSVYPLVKSWGFLNGGYRVPSDSEIESLLSNVDFSRVSVSPMSGSDTYLLSIPAGMELSFGAIAKGCAAAYAVRALSNAGVDSAIISLGGNVQTLGLKPDGSNWTIAVQDPNNTGSYVGLLSLAETAVVTSGGYHRYFDAPDGTRYHHILDPDTGYPADSGLLSVTVVCEDGILADALSTALFILGEEDALEYYKSYGGFEMILVTADDRVVVTGGLFDSFEAYGNSYSFEYVR